MKRQMLLVLSLLVCLFVWAAGECPSVCSNAFLWLDASQTNTMTFSGTEITAWRSVNAGVTAQQYEFPDSAHLVKQPFPEDAALPYVLNVGAGDYAAEVVFVLTNFVHRAKDSQWPQLIGLSNGTATLGLGASTDSDCELFVTGNDGGIVLASYAYPISHAQIRGNGDVGSNRHLVPDADGRVRLRVENHAGELRIILDGETILVTDKNLPNKGSVMQLRFGAGLATLGGGRVESVRFAAISPAVRAGEKLVWADEFEGDALDTRYWTPEQGLVRNAGASQMYIDEPDVLAVTGGVLRLGAKYAPGTLNPLYDPNYTGGNAWRRTTRTKDYKAGAVDTSAKLAVKYGHVEIRARHNSATGAWPAIWLVGQDVKGCQRFGDQSDITNHWNLVTSDNWPVFGEIDMQEYSTKDGYANAVNATLHYGDSWDSSTGLYKTSGSKLAAPSLNCASMDDAQWHLYTLDVSPTAITVGFDGQVVHTANPDSLANPSSGLKPFKDNAFYLVLNFALGGNGTMADAPPPDGAGYPLAMEVDYVRIYQNPQQEGTALYLEGETERDIKRYAALWLDAGKDVVTNLEGVVTNWGAASCYALPSDSPSGPTLDEDGANGLPIMSFGSTTNNCDLGFERVTDARTVFMVAKTEHSANAFLLGDSSDFHFHRGGNGELFHSQHAAAALRGGEVRWNGERIDDPTAWHLPDELGLIEVEATAGVTASQLCYDRKGNGTTPRRGGKDIAELLVFRMPYSQADRFAVRRFLIDKYGLPRASIDAKTVAAGEELTFRGGTVEGLVVKDGGKLVVVGSDAGYAESVTFEDGAIVELAETDGTAVPYSVGFSRDLLVAKSFSGLPTNVLGLAFAVVDNGDGTKTLRATGDFGIAKVVRAHPLLTRGVGRESLAAIDFSGNYGGNMPSVTFRIRFENMTADDLGDIKLYKMPFGTPYAFYAPSATDLSSNFTVSREVSEDKHVVTLTYTPTGSGVWIYPEKSGLRDYSDRVWLTGVLQNLSTLRDDARFYVDVMNGELAPGGCLYKVTNGIASAPHRLYPWRYLVTAYMRRDRINGNTIGTLQNAPEMRWPSLTHAIVSSFDVQYDSGRDSMNIFWNDNAAGAFRRLKEYRDQYHPQCRLVPSLTKGGYVSLDSRQTGSAESRFAIAHAGEKKYRAKFVKYLVAKMAEMGADGLDIDWEYPDDNGKDYNAYGLLMRDLAEAFFDRGWDLSMCSNFGYRMPGGEVMAAADYMSSMAYGQNRGLHSMNTAFTSAVNMLVNRNVPRRRIVVGQAIYSTAKWHMGWDELAGRCGNDDDIINEAWSYNGSSGNFIGFTGPTTYRAKANRVKGVYGDGEYGGIMSWGYYTDTGWYGGKSLGWNQRQTIWPRPYNFPTPKQDADGTYVITNETDWCWFSENAASVAKARLAADIAFNHDPKPIPAFSGVLDGGGHKLTLGSGIWVVAFDKVGLFQTLNGTVRNLTLDVSGRFICRNDRRNDVQSGWTLSAHGGPVANTAVLAAEANAGARIENVHVLLRKGSEVRGNHEVGALVGQAYSAGAAIVISGCTVECFGTVWAKAVDSVNAVITSGDTGNGRVGLLVGNLNFSAASEGVTLRNCSATLRAGGVLSSVCGNYRTLGGLVGNLHVGAGNAKFAWSGLSMTCYEGATVSGLKDNGNTPYCCQPFFGMTFAASGAAKPSLGTANALTFCGASPSGFDSATWLDGIWSFMGATDSGVAPEAQMPVAQPVDNLGIMTVSSLLDLPASKSGDAIVAQCTGGYQIWANVSSNAGNLLSLTLGNTQNGTRVDVGEVARLVPGVHELALTLSQGKDAGTTLYIDGNRVCTRTDYRFSSNPFVEARFGYSGAGLYAYDIVPGALCSVRYPKKASYETVNLITFGRDDDPLTVGNITYPTTLSSATMKAVIWSPDDISVGPIADWKVAKDSTKYVVEAYRESADSTRVKWRNEGSTTRSEAEQTATALGNVGTKTLNFIHRTDNNGTTVSLNAKTAVDSPKMHWSGSAITGAALGLKAGMTVAMCEFLFGTVQKPDDAHPLEGLAEEPAWYPGASGGMRDYYRDAVVDSLGTYEPPTVTINGKEITGGDSARAIYMFGGDIYEEQEHALVLDAPVVGDTGVTLGLRGEEPINAALQFLASAGLSNDWQVAAELSPGSTARSFSFPLNLGGNFYSLKASEAVTAKARNDMPIVSTQVSQADLGAVAGGGEVVVQLEGAGVAEGMLGYIPLDGVAYVARVDADGRMVFNLPSGSGQSGLTLVIPAGAANGDIRIAESSTRALVTEVVADNLYGDGFTTHSFGSYRIPSLVSDGQGEVLCLYDVRYGGGDLGTGDGIDIGETYSGDYAWSFEKPRLAIDVPNKRERDQSQRSGWNKTWDIGDVATLYDPATRTYWLMGMTGTGLYQGNYSMNDVVMYTRGKGKGTVWTPWRNPESNSTDPMEYRSIKETIMSQPGITNSVGSKGYGFLEGPGHGFVTTVGKEGVMPKGTLVFPTQYFVDSSLTKTTVGAVYSKDHGTNWIATTRSTQGTGPQENCVMELDDGSWYMTTKAGSRPGTGRINFFRTTNYTNWVYVGEHYPVPCQQGSCLRLGTNKTDGKGRYVLCHTLHPDTATRARVALVFGTDTTASDTAGVAWDFDHPQMLYYDNTGGKGYNSLCMVDDHTLGVLYEAQGHIYFVRIDVSERLK